MISRRDAQRATTADTGNTNADLGDAIDANVIDEAFLVVGI